MTEPILEGQSPVNPRLKQLVDQKRLNEYTPDAASYALGFRGWHERGYLPHFDAPDVTQFLTFHLTDAFPVTRHAEWESLLKEPDDSLRRRQLEQWLDRGHGECWLRRDPIAEQVEAALLADHGNLYSLQAWVIMPNHVHVVIDVWKTPLRQIIKKWKGATSRKSNAFLKRTGAFWQDDYWDTHIRDEKHLTKAIRYLENNPTKAYLARDPRQWQWGSARLRDHFGQLPEKLKRAE